MLRQQIQILAFYFMKLMVASTMFLKKSRQWSNYWIPNLRCKTNGTERCHASQKQIFELPGAQIQTNVFTCLTSKTILGPSFSYQVGQPGVWVISYSTLRETN